MARNEAIVRRRSEELEGFAGRVAHDLLNPISAAEMSLAAAERGAAGNDRMLALAARGKRSLNRARALVDDLFAFAQAGARPLPGMTTSVAEVVEGVIEELRAPALERNITINVTPLVAPVAVRCANGVLASLLSNLVRNAIKHMGGSTRRQVDVRIEPRHIASASRCRTRGRGCARAGVERIRSVCPGGGHVRTGPGPGPGDRAAAGRGPFRPLRRLSRPGEGALFWFELPAADHSAAHELPAVEPFNDRRPPANSASAARLYWRKSLAESLAESFY